MATFHQVRRRNFRASPCSGSFSRNRIYQNHASDISDSKRVSGHETLVVAFAQVPGSIEEPARIVTGKSTIPMLLQGVAWIDGIDFRILQLHMDLLAPQPEIGYLKQTSDLLYGSARIRTLNLDVWVPRVVDVETDDGRELWQEQHQYSKYRLYEAKSRITLNP